MECMGYGVCEIWSVCGASCGEAEAMPMLRGEAEAMAMLLIHTSA